MGEGSLDDNEVLNNKAAHSFEVFLGNYICFDLIISSKIFRMLLLKKFSKAFKFFNF